MKKRILSLLLAVITIFHMFPVFALPAIAEDEVTGIDVADMEVGKLYSAEFIYEYEEFVPQKPSDTEGEENLLEWKGYDEGVSWDDAYVPMTDFPADLIVKRISEDDLYYVYVTNEDWPAEYDEYRYVAGDDLIITGEYVAPPADDGLIYGQVGLVMDGKTVETLTIAKGEKTHVFTELGSVIQGTPTYRWQLLIDRENNRWADIRDYVYPYAPISEALIANAGLDGAATLRCIATQDGVSYASGELDISVDPSLPSPELPLIPEPETEAETEESTEPESQNTDSLAVPAGRMVRSGSAARSGNAGAVEAFHIVINYTIRHATAVDSELDGSSAAGTHTVTRPIGGSYKGSVPSPPVAGYLPYVLAEHVSYIEGEKPDPITYDGEEYYLAASIHFDAVASDTTVNVYFIPQPVNFLVKIYEQNLHNDEYVLAGTVIESGLADAKVGERLDTARTGFSALYYDPNVPISDDGTGEVEIYYDRNYYLVKFELDSDEAYGATPYYVRYGSQVMLPTPTRPGYTFTGWKLDRVYTVFSDDSEQEITDTTITAPYDQKDAGKLITVQHNADYSAGWYASTTSYTIAYWLEDPEYVDPDDPNDVDPNEKYKIWGIQNVTGVTAGTTVDGPAAGDVPTDWTTYDALVKDDGNRYREINELNYLDYVSSDQDVEVKGDGSTVVNVYYDRKEYTLKFYYARSEETGNNIRWYVAGQTDAGTSFVQTKSNDELTCLYNNRDSFGQVDSQPTFKDGVVADKRYTLGSESHNDYKYYYLSFKAKYGADISDQYPCDVFNSVERTSNQYSNGWSDKTVLMSAWSGEYNVLFSRVGGNQTMKGKYQILDYRMLWDPDASGWNTAYNDNTVSYLAFWENAINASWNVPELYRYKIWLQVLDGQDLSGKTTYVYNGITYYLADFYDTCDNSQVSQQTQPTLIGFTRNGYTSRGDIGGNNYNANTWTDQPDLTRTEIADIKNSIMPGTYKEAWIVNYFYTRNTADLSFSDTYTTPEVKKVPYEQSLSGYATKVPDYPSSIEKGAIVFAGDLDGDGIGDGTGWYLDENYTLPFSFDTVMGVDNIQLYAKWEDCSYTATIYLDSKKQTRLGDPQTVLFGSPIKEPNYKDAQANNPAYAKLIFAGWYYMDGTEEKRFDFKTMVLKQNLEIYAKWTSKVPVPYTVYYAIKNADGSYTQIADTTKGMSLAGISKSFTAKVGTDLDKDYRTGYFPANRSHSMHMSNTEANEYTFVYSASSEVRYSVVHQFVNDEFVSIIGVNTITLTLETTITSTTNQAAFVSLSFRDGVTRAAIASATGKSLTESQKDDLWTIVTNMSPDCYQQDLILTTNTEENVAYFNWVDREAVSIYQVIHKFQSLNDPYTYVAELPMEFVGNIGDTATATAVERYGFTRKAESVSGEITKVEYKNGAWTGGLVLELYYDRDEYNYTVHHYKIGTTTSVADSTTSNAPFETIVKISDVKKDVSGYTLANGDTTVEISKEGQEIICYYQGLEVLYYYKISGSIAGGYLEPDNAITYVDSAPESSTLHLLPGYILKEWYYTVGDSTEKISVPDTWLSGDRMTVSPEKAPAEWAGKAINIYAEVQPTSLTITNSFAATPAEPHDCLKNQGFIYQIKGKEDTDTENYSLTVALPEGERQTILGLPAGEYTITVQSSWSWRYPSTNITCEIDDGIDSWAAGAQKLTFEFDGSAIVSFSFEPPTNDDAPGKTGFYITSEAHN